VAHVIGDAAGNDLIGECEMYKQAHGLLPTAAVTHTTAGKLRLRIEYVIHTVGPHDYGDKDELQTILTKTYYSVIKYASEILRIPKLCLPAISSGIFQVKLESVVRAFYTAVKQYVDEHAQTSHTPILQNIRFVCNSLDTTASAAALLQELYTIDQPVCTPTSTPIEPPTPTPTPSGRQAGRRRRANQRVEERMEIWTPDLLRLKQAENHDINTVIQWLTHYSKPDWNTVRSQSPALKAYWHQWDNLKIIDGILYRQLEPLNESDIIVKQLLLPGSLKTEFLDSVHTGLAGHMGMTKTSAHVTRRAYWY